jgi:hypothetical protein
MTTSSEILAVLSTVCYLFAPNFRLILIAETDTVYDKLPTPLINRLEKHFVLTSSILESWQRVVLRKFEQWITKFSKAGYGVAC